MLKLHSWVSEMVVLGAAEPTALIWKFLLPKIILHVVFHQNFFILILCPVSSPLKGIGKYLLADFSVEISNR